MKLLIKSVILIISISFLFSINLYVINLYAQTDDDSDLDTKTAEEIRKFDKEIKKEEKDLEKKIIEDETKRSIDLKKKVKKRSKKRLIPKTEIMKNFWGINLMYSGSTLFIPDGNTTYINPETSAGGGGFDMYYQSYISKVFAYQIVFSFLVGSFDNQKIGEYYDPMRLPQDNPIKVGYNQTESFYNFVGGFTFRYYLYLDKIFGSGAGKKMFPYFSTGLLTSAIFKSYKHEYNLEGADPWIDKEDQSKWLPASLTLPFSFGINFMLSPNDGLNVCFTYMYIMFNETTQKYGYNNITNFKIGYMRTLNFKL